jgi:capsular polysaccharide biosynthesis protein
MPNNVESKGITISVKIYERLLATYPKNFRREYGSAMKQLFRDQCRDAWSAGRGRGLAVLWLRVLPDWAKTSVVQHLLNLHKRESMFMKIVRAFRADARPRTAFVRVFAVVFLLCVITSALLSICSPKQFFSMVQVEVQKDDPEVAPVEPHQSMGDADPSFLTTQSKIIESYRVLTNVIVNLHLDEKLARQNGGTNCWSMDETYDFLVRQLSVEQTRMTSLIEISVRNQSPELAASIANAVAHSYAEFRIERWKDSHFRGITALEDKQASMANDLLEADKKQLARLLLREIDMLRQPNPVMVIVSNPARPDLNSVVPTKWRIFLMWIGGGTLLAAMAGVGSAWIARQTSAR